MTLLNILWGISIYVFASVYAHLWENIYFHCKDLHFLSKKGVHFNFSATNIRLNVIIKQDMLQLNLEQVLFVILMKIMFILIKLSEIRGNFVGVRFGICKFLAFMEILFKPKYRQAICIQKTIL